MPDPDDLEAVRARVRTAVDRWTGTDTLVLDKADVLALLAPTLTFVRSVPQPPLLLGRRAAMSDEVTIDVGPVFCPSCKREFGNTERDRLASLVEKLRQWVCCPRCGWMDGEPRNPAHQGCEDCEPLADLLTEMENQ